MHGQGTALAAAAHAPTSAQVEAFWMRTEVILEREVHDPADMDALDDDEDDNALARAPSKAQAALAAAKARALAAAGRLVAAQVGCLRALGAHPCAASGGGKQQSVVL